MRRWTSNMSRKGQVTVPVEIRRELGFRPNEPVPFVMEDGQVRIESALARLRSNHASIPALDPPRSWWDVREGVHDEVAENALNEMNQHRED